MSKLCVLIVAGGHGARFGGAEPKQFRQLRGRSVLARSIEPFIAAGIGADIVVAVAPAAVEQAWAQAPAEATIIATGKATRTGTVAASLEQLATLPEPPTTILIHDAARPLVSPETIRRVVAALATHDGAVPGLPLSDALWRCDEGGALQGPVDREGVWRACTPQGFRFDALLDAYRQHPNASVTDDAGIARLHGLSLMMVASNPENIKLTRPEDEPMMQRLIAEADRDICTGQGFDVHRLGPGGGLRLCGVEIPCPFRLLGHSDADVALHALTDALLGCLCDGDIGSHFPPGDPQWRGADSRLFVVHALERLRARDGRLIHADLTLIAEAPKLMPHQHAMRAALAGMLDLPGPRIGLKATTTEGLGFTGRGEGIAAQAIVTVSLPALAGAQRA